MAGLSGCTTTLFLVCVWCCYILLSASPVQVSHNLVSKEQLPDSSSSSNHSSDDSSLPTTHTLAGSQEGENGDNTDKAGEAITNDVAKKGHTEVNKNAEGDEVSRSKIMALSDDVITDALFTNIDTLQDHLEVCEEGLRQKLRMYSHGEMLQQVEPKDAMPEEEGVRMPDDGSREDDEDEEDDEDDESDDSDVENDRSLLKENASVKKKIPKKVTPGKSRNRRSAGENQYANNHPLSRAVAPPANSHVLGRAEALAQKVVSRLSDRFEYLRSSLVQCHLLYRQFATLQ